MECKPLNTLQELFNWAPEVEHIRQQTFNIKRSTKYMSGRDWVENAKCWEWLVKHPLSEADDEKPRTLLCHDMMGGYLADRFLEPVQNQDGYSFLHWNCLDVFVYFSHSFITIPPTGWILAAKNHGVKILGTIITEGAQGKRILEEILRDESKIDAFVEKSADIANFYGFQGWLLNLENPVEWTLVPYLLELVKKLTAKIHEVYGSEGMVLWYDSVTIQGKLHWQNQLNDLNKPFMDNCDGIFLNYGWRAPDSWLDSSQHSLLNSVQSLENDSRRRDIYVGIDVFGRGVLGGGGLNSNVAMDKIRQFYLSSAIFAPGWTYESSLEDKVPKKEYVSKEHLFWSKLDPYLDYHAIKIDLEELDTSEPKLIFETNFFTGRGSNCYDLLSMQTQPTLPTMCLQTHKDRACDGLASSEGGSSGYCCHTVDPKSDETSGLRICANKKTELTVPLFLMELKGEGADFLFLISGNFDRDEIHPCQIVLGTDKGEEIVAAPVFPDLMDQLLPKHHLQQDADKKGFVVQNCYDTIEKIGLRLDSLANFNLERMGIYRL